VRRVQNDLGDAAGDGEGNHGVPFSSRDRF
jgi:hypothetical protein